MVKKPSKAPSQLQEDRELPQPVLASPDEVFEDQSEKVLLYGAYGTGKTFAALTAPDPIWFLCMGGRNELKTLYSKEFIEKHGKKEVHVTSVKEDYEEQGQMSDNPSGFDKVCDAIDGFIEADQQHGLGVKTIIVDNATFLEYYMLNKAIAAEFMIASGDVSKTVLKREREWGIRKPHDSTWGGAQSLMDRIVRWLFELPYNVVFVAHQYETSRQKRKSRERELVKVEPLFVGKQRTEIPNLFDNVWHCSTSGGGKNIQYVVQTVADQGIAAKTRVGGVLSWMERDLNLSEAIKDFQKYSKNLDQEE